MYHYRGTGLDNVYLENGYHEVEYGDEVATSVVNVEGLHKAIATALISQSAKLGGKEIRFLRNEMDMPQTGLADLLDVNVQTIANWEKGNHAIKGPAEKLIRLYAGARLLNRDSKIGKLLEQFAKIDSHEIAERLYFSQTEEVWEEAA